jgi:DNA-binding NarL/FixJ family response regulator
MARSGCILNNARDEITDSAVLAVDRSPGAVSVSNDDPSRDIEPPDPPRLFTSRELQVMRLIARGMSIAEIAETLFISRRTAEAHVGRILTKMGVRSRAEALEKIARLLEENDDGEDIAREIVIPELSPEAL